MRSILTEPLAATIVVLDEADRATLSDIARVSGKAVSTIQRAIDALERDGVVRRETRRGALVFRPDAPRTALRDLANWVLGSKRTRELATAARPLAKGWPDIPPSIQDPHIRRAWREALSSIVRGYRPAKVILFGSQARGDASPDSDVDLLVVFDRIDERRDLRIELARSLRDVPFPKDVLVTTRHELAHPMPGTAIAEAAHEGLVVYER